MALDQTIKKKTVKAKTISEGLKVDRAYVSSKHVLYICIEDAGLQGSLRVPLYKYMPPYRNSSIIKSDILHSFSESDILNTCSLEPEALFDDVILVKRHEIPVMQVDTAQIVPDQNGDKKEPGLLEGASETLYVLPDGGDISFLYVNKDTIFINTDRISIKIPDRISTNNNQVYFRALYIFMPFTIIIDIVTFPIQLVVAAFGAH